MAILVFEHGANTGSLRLGETLRDYGHRLDVRRLYEGDAVPSDLEDVDAIVSCGGPRSSNDGSQSWLDGEMELLRMADAQALPIVGICLGSQILARALGGEVGPVENGIELGWHPVTLNDAGRDDILHTGIGWETIQFHWHSEQVTSAPPGARVLSTSKQCPVQAWAKGLRTYGFQYHPEAFAHTPGQWAADDPTDLEKAGITLEELNEQTQRHFGDFARLADRLFESIAMFLMPVDRRYVGIVRDLHH